MTVFSSLPLFGGFSGAIRQFVVNNLMPASAGRVISVYMQQFADNAGRLTTWGVAILGLSALITMLTIDRAFNTIWRVRRPRTLWNRLLIYWAVLTVGPLLIGASLSVTSWLLTLSMGVVWGRGSGTRVAQDRPADPHRRRWRFSTGWYRRAVSTRDAVAGGAAAGAAFEGHEDRLRLVHQSVPTFKLVYGAFASFRSSCSGSTCPG